MSWSSDFEVSRIATGQLSTSAFVEVLSSVVVGTKAYLLISTNTSGTSTNLLEFDLSTMTVNGTALTVTGGYNIATDGTSGYVCTGSNIIKINLGTWSVTSTTAFAAERIEVSGTTGYGIDFGSPLRIRNIDLTTMTAGTVTSLPFNASEGGASALNGNFLYYATEAAQRILRAFNISTLTDAGLVTVPAPIDTIIIDSTGTWGYVATRENFYRINVSNISFDGEVETDTQLPTVYRASKLSIIANDYPRALPRQRGFTATGRWGLFSSGYSDRSEVALIDLFTGQVAGTTQLATTDNTLQHAFTDGTYIYLVANQNPANVLKIELPDTEPCVNGFDWNTSDELNLPVSGLGVGAVAWTVDSSTSEDIAILWTYNAEPVTAAGDVIDIYDTEDLRPTSVIDRGYFPTSDNSGVRRTGYRWDGTRPIAYDTAISTFFDKVDDDPFISAGNFRARTNTGTDLWGTEQLVANRQFIGLTAWDTTVATITYKSARSEWWFYHANLVVPVPADEERIVRVGLRIEAQRLINARAVGGEFDQPYYVRLGLNISGRTYWSPQILVPDGQSTIEYFWPRNPDTGQEWTYLDLPTFGGPGYTAVEMRRPNVPGVILDTVGAIYRFQFITQTTAETRSGVALRTNYRTVRYGWTNWTVRRPDSLLGTPFKPWAKQIDRTYLFDQRLDAPVVSDATRSLAINQTSVRALTTETGINGILGTNPEYVDGVPVSVGDSASFVPAIVLRGEQPGNAFSFDAQPYADVTAGDGTAVVRASNDSAVAQEVWFDASTFSPDRIRFSVRGADVFGAVPNSRLWVRVYNGSITSSGLEATAGPVYGSDLSTASQWTEFDLPLANTNWSTGSDYKHVVVFTVDGGDDPWEVLTVANAEEGAASLSFVGTPLGYKASSWYDTLTGSGWTRTFLRSIFTGIGQQPDTPTGLIATLRDWTSAPGFGQHIELEWDGLTGSEECSTLGYYEVQRLSETADTSSPFYSGWQTVFTAAVDGSEPSYIARDFEAIRHSKAVATNKYRIRLVNEAGFASDWSSEVTVTMLADDRCQYSFMSNQYPALNQWYTDIGSRSYGLLETVTYFEFEGRDGAQALRPATDRLDEFALSLLVAADGAVDPTPDIRTLDERGRRRFDLLAVLSGNKRSLQLSDTLVDFDGLMRLPYIAVLDNRGNRWFADLRVSEGTETEPGGRHRYDVNVREVSRNPAATPLVLHDGELISEYEYALTVAPAAPSAPSDPAIPVIMEPPDVTITGTSSSDVEANGYRVAVWTSSGSFTLNSGTLDVEWFVVGGGGSGGGSSTNNTGGGGGGGGVVTNEGSPYRLTAGTYTVTVGAGGPGADFPNPGSAGSASSFGSLASAAGGGRGGVGNLFWVNGGAGGSGGGAGFATANGLPGSGTSGQGNKGGIADVNLTPVKIGGGGGGAYESGASSSDLGTKTWGGAGIYNNWTGGSFGNRRYGSGGSGGASGVSVSIVTENPRAGGYQAFGGGGIGVNTQDGGNATANSGSGGGGAGGSATNSPHRGGDGAAGIVMLRWKPI